MGSRVRGKYVKAFSKNEFKFREARIVFGNKGARVGVLVGMGGPDGLSNLFGNEGWGITTGEEGWCRCGGHQGSCRFSAPRWQNRMGRSSLWMTGSSWRN